MFNQMKALGAVAGMLRDRERLSAATSAMKERLERARLEGEAAGGAVRVVMSGKGSAIEVAIAPALLASGDSAMVGAAVRDAMNDALEKTQALLRAEAERTAAELGLPDASGLAQMLGAS